MLLRIPEQNLQKKLRVNLRSWRCFRTRLKQSLTWNRFCLAHFFLNFVAFSSFSIEFGAQSWSGFWASRASVFHDVLKFSISVNFTILSPLLLIFLDPLHERRISFDLMLLWVLEYIVITAIDSRATFTKVLASTFTYDSSFSALST